VTDAPAPLAGVRVLDFSRVLAGPIVGRVLSDLGADVVKVEPPEGDLVRYAHPQVNSISLYYAQQNCGKRNISLDLHHPDAIDVCTRLAARADVVLENSRPGVMDRLGLGYAHLSAVNPRVVYGSISGYGQTGVWAERRAYAVVVHAEAGLLHAGARWRAAAGDANAAPVQDPMSHADVYAGLSCASAVLAALFARERTGTGQHVEVAMAEAMLFVNDFAHWGYSPVDPGDRWPTLAPSFSPIVRTADGRDVVIAGDPVGPGVFESYGRILDRDDLARDPRFAEVVDRRAHRTALLDIVREWAASHTTDAVLAACAAVGLATGVVRAVDEIVDSEWARERGVLVGVPDGGGGAMPVVQTPFRFSGATVGVRGAPAYRGEHNREVLREIGFADAEIDRLERDGVLSARPPRHRRASAQ
jgi:crotonobetainyl-CoA:carnitine CoA-transferase CaiB-like acyl-CoA transferase